MTKLIPYNIYRQRNFPHIIRNWRESAVREKWKDDAAAYAQDKKRRALEFTDASPSQAEDFRIAIVRQLEKNRYASR